MKRHILFILAILYFGINAYAQHTLIMKSGEKTEGVVIELKNDTIIFYVNLMMEKVPLRDVSAIYFNEYVAYKGDLLKNDDVKSIWSGDYLIKYVLKDRVMITPPVITIGTEDKGTIVVLVVVDRYGNVVESEPGYVGSNTSNKYLLTKAKFAAQGAKFEKHMTGPPKTKGTIIITY